MQTDFESAAQRRSFWSSVNQVDKNADEHSCFTAAMSNLIRAKRYIPSIAKTDCLCLWLGLIQIANTDRSASFSLQDCQDQLSTLNFLLRGRHAMNWRRSRKMHVSINGAGHGGWHQPSGLGKWYDCRTDSSDDDPLWWWIWSCLWFMIVIG